MAAKASRPPDLRYPVHGCGVRHVGTHRCRDCGADKPLCEMGQAGGGPAGHCKRCVVAWMLRTSAAWR